MGNQTAGDECCWPGKTAETQQGTRRVYTSAEHELLCALRRMTDDGEKKCRIISSLLHIVVMRYAMNFSPGPPSRSQNFFFCVFNLVRKKRSHYDEKSMFSIQKVQTLYFHIIIRASVGLGCFVRVGG